MQVTACQIYLYKYKYQDQQDIYLLVIHIYIIPFVFIQNVCIVWMKNTIVYSASKIRANSKEVVN
jgi:hypothetical protein